MRGAFGVAISLKCQEESTVYIFVYTTVAEKPEIARILLKELVGASGFEPPTSWSRTVVSKILSRFGGVA
jgi:hypothetical protein